MKVYEKIAAVMAEMSKTGISKSGQNTQQNYKFRGIDQVYAALSPLLSAHGLCVLPRVVSRTVTEQPTRSGGVAFYTVLTVEFDFVAAEDGSKHTVCTVGEAMDSGDKSTNKAMSAAYKYACFLAFCIPTEGDNDADATTHEAGRVDTKLVNKYSAAIIEAVNKGSDDGLKELMAEIKTNDQAFRAAVWSTLPKPVKDHILTVAPKEA